MSAVTCPLFLAPLFSVATEAATSDPRAWFFGVYGFWWLLAAGGSALALWQAWQFFQWMEGQPAGTDKMIEIAEDVRKGAYAYLKQ
ncbi:MAG: hypothetical protein EBS56_09925, partial [Planctomycetia bacterium]|nr:hypothetical protein [Planctomycetia bacterium]